MLQRRTTHPAAVLGLVIALVSALLMALGGAAPASAVGCSTASTNGTVTKTVWVGAEARSYNLHVPTGLTGDTPLLIDLHGLGSNAFFQEVSTGWSTYADQQKFIVAYPAGSAWGQAWDVNGTPDVTFIRKAVEQIRATYCVDGQRIFAEGGSLGGLMAQRLLCNASDMFASAVSTISGAPDYLGGTCSPARPVAVGVINSESDPLFTADQSIHARDYWLAKNGCSTVGTPDPNPYGANGQLYSGCNAGVHVMWRTYVASGHSYPTGAGLEDLKAKAWGFLMANPHP